MTGRLLAGQALGELLARSIDPGDRRAVERLADRLADRDTVSRLLDRELARVAADPYAQPRCSGAQIGAMRGLVLHKDAEKSAMLFAYLRDRRDEKEFSLQFGAGRTLVVFHNDRPIKVDIYRAPCPPAVDGQFDPSLLPSCRLARTIAVATGDRLMLDRETEAMRIVAGAAPVPFIRVTWRGSSALPARQYGMPGGGFIRASMADEADGRAQSMLSALRPLADRLPAKTLARTMRIVCKSDDFTLRWHALRCWLAIDAVAAQPQLTHMAIHDPHPAVRTAAVAALRLFDRHAA